MAVVGNVDILITATSERLGRDLAAAGTHVRRFERQTTTSIKTVERQTFISSKNIKTLLSGLGIGGLGGGFGLLKLGAVGAGIAGLTTMVDLLVRGRDATAGFSSALVKLGEGLGIVGKQSDEASGRLQRLIEKLEERRQQQFEQFEKVKRDKEGFFEPERGRIFEAAFKLREGAAKQILELEQFGPQRFFDEAMKDARDNMGIIGITLKERARIQDRANQKLAEEIAKARENFRVAQRALDLAIGANAVRGAADFQNAQLGARAVEGQQRQDFARWDAITNRLRIAGIGGMNLIADTVSGFSGINLRAPGVSIGRMLGEASNAMIRGGGLLGSLFGGDSNGVVQFQGGPKGSVSSAQFGTQDFFKQLHNLEDQSLSVEQDQLTELETIAKNTGNQLRLVQVRM
jgi:hypothetical protein